MVSMSLPYPFDYYWKKYMNGKCPFCNEDIEYTFENDIETCKFTRWILQRMSSNRPY